MRKPDRKRLHRRRGDTAAANGRLVRRRIAELGFTQAEFADEKDIPQRTLERVLAGRRVLKVVLVRLAAGLSLRYADIVVVRDARSAWVRRHANLPFGGTKNRSRDRKLVQSANKLRFEFQRTTQGKRPPLRAGDFSTAAALIDAMCALDSNNGHAHYYAGEIKRWIGRWQESHQHFFRYLDFYEQVFAPIQESDAGLEHCYRTAHGYGRERTAWIHHLVARDLWRQGRVNGDRGILEHALKHANAALDYFPGGFVQSTSTARVRDAIKSAIAAPRQRTAPEAPVGLVAARPHRRFR